MKNLFINTLTSLLIAATTPPTTAQTLQTKTTLESIVIHGEIKDQKRNTVKDTAIVTIKDQQGKTYRDTTTAQYEITIPGSTAVNEQTEPEQPQKFRLEQNYPNPFNPSTKIEYQFKKPANIKLSIYNILGQEITTLVEKHQSEGFYAARWNGATKQGKKAAAGI